MVAAPPRAGPLRLCWPRRGRDGPSIGTGDLRFDGAVRVEGAAWRASAWLAADLRAAIHALTRVGPGRLEIDRGQLRLCVRPHDGAALPSDSRLTEWAARSARGLRGLLDVAQLDPDPRARALAARRLIERLRRRDGASVRASHRALLESRGLPDWIQLEAFLRLWRACPRERGRWVELALRRRRSSLARVATQAVLWSEVSLVVPIRLDPVRTAAELDLAWRRGSDRDRSRLRNRVEDLPGAAWARLRAASTRRARSTFAILDAARHGALSALNSTGGELAPAPDSANATKIHCDQSE